MENIISNYRVELSSESEISIRVSMRRRVNELDPIQKTRFRSIRPVLFRQIASTWHRFLLVTYPFLG